MAVCLCVVSWVYVHIFLLPGLVMDDLVYRLDDGTCNVNTTAQRSWGIPTQFVVYNTSVFIVAISYPVIWWKVRQRMTINPRVNHGGRHGATTTPTVKTVGEISHYTSKGHSDTGDY